MISNLRKRISTPAGALAVIALVLALGGTALAASGALSSKQKKEVEKIAKKFAGKPGAAGPAGTNGTNGTNGPAGKEGPQGKQGEKGSTGNTGPQGATGAQGPQGATGAQGPQGATGPQGPKGDPGETGFTEFLPEGKTETGTWAFGRTSEIAFAPISFNIPLGKALEEEHVHYVPIGGPTPEACEGFTAAPGNLCVFEQFSEHEVEPPLFFAPFEGGLGAAGTHGTVMHFFTGTNAVAQGIWAVTESK